MSGFDILFKEDVCILVKGNENFNIAKFEIGLYKILSTENQEKLMTVQQDNLRHWVHEWHMIMALQNLNDICKMDSQGLKIISYKCSDV